jgi:signal transduction histidine kinase
MSYGNISDPAELHALIDSILTLVGEPDLTSALKQVVKSATELAGARYGALGVLNEAKNELSDFITYGLTDEQVNAIRKLPTRHGILGVMITELKPVRISNIVDDNRSTGFPKNHPIMNSFLGVPIVLAGSAFGNLYLADKIDGGDFDEDDEKLLEAFSKATGVILEKARLHDRIKRLSLIEDRERIARSLHDNVIQRLFAIGIKMQAKTSKIEPESVRDLFEDSVNEIDVVIHDIRKTIFAIDQQSLLTGRDLLNEIDKIIEDFEKGSSINFTVTHSGNLNRIMDSSIFDHLVCIAREVITNAVKHAFAENINVGVMFSDLIELSVTDDGTGFDFEREYSGNGLKNIKSRASLTDGDLTINKLNGKGTGIVFKVAANEF